MSSAQPQPPTQRTYVTLAHHAAKYGYASGPQGLATLFQESGGRVFLHHRLINISVSAHAAKNITLTFNVTSGAVPRITTLPHAVSNVFL